MLESLLQPSSFDLRFIQFEGPVILLFPAIFAALAALVIPLFWAYWDAVKRAKNGFALLALLLITGYPISFIWWFWLRPPTRKFDA